MFTGEIDAYILSHIDEEGDLLSALNRDANVNLLRPRMLSGHLQGRIFVREESWRSGLIRLMPLCVWRKAWKRGH